MPIVLDSNRAPHLPLFLEFLAQCNHSRITLDQWDSFLLFNHSVQLDLTNFEDDGACKSTINKYNLHKVGNNVNLIDGRATSIG